MGLFHEPETAQEIVDWIERLPGSDRPYAMTVFGMTWNLCAKLTAIKADNEEDVAE
jgi:hypothetical protein